MPHQQPQRKTLPYSSTPPMPHFTEDVNTLNSSATPAEFYSSVQASLPVPIPTFTHPRAPTAVLGNSASSLQHADSSIRHYFNNSASLSYERSNYQTPNPQPPSGRGERSDAEVSERNSSTNLFFRRLPRKITAEEAQSILPDVTPSTAEVDFDEKYLRVLCEAFGRIVSLAIMRNIHTGESRGTAFVRFEHHLDALTALQHFSQTRVLFPGHQSSNETLTVQWAKREHDDAPAAMSEKAKMGALKLFIRNIPTHITEAELHAVVAPFGEVSTLMLHPDTAAVRSSNAFDAAGNPPEEADAGQSHRQIAFVSYQNAGEAAAACAALHSQFPFGQQAQQGIPLLAKIAEDSRHRKMRKGNRSAGTVSTTSLNEVEEMFGPRGPQGRGQWSATPPPPLSARVEESSSLSHSWQPNSARTHPISREETSIENVPLIWSTDGCSQLHGIGTTAEMPMQSESLPLNRSSPSAATGGSRPMPSRSLFDNNMGNQLPRFHYAGDTSYGGAGFVDSNNTSRLQNASGSLQPVSQSSAPRLSPPAFTPASPVLLDAEAGFDVANATAAHTHQQPQLGPSRERCDRGTREASGAQNSANSSSTVVPSDSQRAASSASGTDAKSLAARRGIPSAPPRTTPPANPLRVSQTLPTRRDRGPCREVVNQSTSIGLSMSGSASFSVLSPGSAVIGAGSAVSGCLTSPPNQNTSAPELFPPPTHHAPPSLNTGTVEEYPIPLNADGRAPVAASADSTGTHDSTTSNTSFTGPSSTPRTYTHNPYAAVCVSSPPLE